ncbi:MAG: metallophosphoesterase family protein, partial [Pseudomonadota bacterium]
MSSTKIGLDEANLPAGLRIYAVGDVHGCLSELRNLMDKISVDIHSRPIPEYKIVFLGDYVDRGPDSNGCVQYLMDLSNSDPNIICLLGNHEDKLLKFLNQPMELAESFFGYGGRELCLSYGVEIGCSSVSPADVRDELVHALPSVHLSFLSNLKTHVTFGDYFFVHAGIRPGVALGQQDPHDLIWIRHEFVNHKELF